MQHLMRSCTNVFMLLYSIISLHYICVYMCIETNTQAKGPPPHPSFYSSDQRFTHPAVFKYLLELKEMMLQNR